MGLFSKLRGTDRPPEVERAVSELEGLLPDGWRFVEFRKQMFCRRPVKLMACGATAEGPDGHQVLAVSTDDEAGVLAVRALVDAVDGRAVPSAHWAPPPIQPREADRDTWALVEPENDEEATARSEALGLLPEGVAPMNVDSEKFGTVRVFAVVAQMPDRTGMAGVGLTAADAWRALAQRLRGNLAASPVWFPAVDR